jgi:phage repressor protein C with HTH and peptisase S24 domain
MNENIPTIFTTALRYYLQDSPRGTSTKLSSILGIKRDQIYHKIHDRRAFSENERRRIAAYFNIDYESFLATGRALLTNRPAPTPGFPEINHEELENRGFIAVPFSDHMKLAAGRGGYYVPFTEEALTSPVIIHGPSLGKRSPRNLQAFWVDGDSMEPLIAKGGIVLVDLKDNKIEKLKNRSVYVLCYDLEEGICAVKYLSWAVKNEILAIESHDHDGYPNIYRPVEEVYILGRVIWAWRKL